MTMPTACCCDTSTYMTYDARSVGQLNHTSAKTAKHLVGTVTGCQDGNKKRLLSHFQSAFIADTKTKVEDITKVSRFVSKIKRDWAGWASYSHFRAY